jgi:hypothetical protein
MTQTFLPLGSGEFEAWSREVEVRGPSGDATHREGDRFETQPPG